VGASRGATERRGRGACSAAVLLTDRCTWVSAAGLSLAVLPAGNEDALLGAGATPSSFVPFGEEGESCPGGFGGGGAGAGADGFGGAGRCGIGLASDHCGAMLKGTGSGGGVGLELDFPAAGLRGCVRGVLGRAPLLVAGEAEGEEGETDRALAESDEGEGGPALSPLAAATALAESWSVRSSTSRPRSALNSRDGSPLLTLVLTLVLPALVSGEQEGDAACCVSLGDGGGDAAPDGESGEEREAGCHGIGL